MTRRAQLHDRHDDIVPILDPVLRAWLHGEAHGSGLSPLKLRTANASHCRAELLENW